MNLKIINDEDYLDSLLEKYQINKYFTDLSRIRSGIRLIKFPRNTFIYSLEEHKKYVYFLIFGQLNVYANVSNGNSMLIRYCNEFIFLGDMELMEYTEPSNTIQTKTECLCIGIDISTMKNRLLDDNKFLLYLCKSLADKLAYLGSSQRLKQLNSASQNIAEYIIVASESKGYFKANLKDVASVLGISYRHLHRIIGTLVEKNILQRSNRGYEILDMDSLKFLSNPDNHL